MAEAAASDLPGPASRVPPDRVARKRPGFPLAGAFFFEAGPRPSGRYENPVKQPLLTAAALAAIVATAAIAAPADTIRMRQANYKQIGAAMKGINEQLRSGAPSIDAIRAGSRTIVGFAPAGAALVPARHRPRGRRAHPGAARNLDRSCRLPPRRGGAAGRGARARRGRAARRSRRDPGRGAAARPCLLQLPRRLRAPERRRAESTRSGTCRRASFIGRSCC